jgi:hypothetical protein
MRNSMLGLTALVAIAGLPAACSGPDPSKAAGLENVASPLAGAPVAGDPSSGDPFKAAVFTDFNPGEPTCDGPSPGTGQPGGFVTAVPQGDGTIQVNLHLRNAVPNTTYSIADTCHYFTTYTVTTNGHGVGNASFILPLAGQTSWVFDGYAGASPGDPRGGHDASGPGYFDTAPIILP